MLNAMKLAMQKSERALKLLHSAVVWDNHACMPLRENATFLPQLERYRSAGIDIVSLNVGMAEQSADAHLRIIRFMRDWLMSQPERYRLISTVDDVRRSKADGKLGVVFDIEGMYPVQGDPSLVRTFYDLGARWMLIAYNRNNAAGGGCLDVDEGLTKLGMAVIDEMERVGMVLCLSHTGARTAAEALEYAHNPVIFSHSNPRGDVEHPRNVSDALIRSCARTGGVVGLSGIGSFLGAGRENLVERLLHQVRYLVDLVGAEHVGLSIDYVFDQSDFEESFRLHPELYPAGTDPASPVMTPEHMHAIVEGLASQNLSDTQIRGVLGDNWLRVAEKVWRERARERR